RDDVAPGLEHSKVRRPGPSRARPVARTHVHAVDEDDALAFAFVEIARSDAIDVEPFLVAHVGGRWPIARAGYGAAGCCSDGHCFRPTRHQPTPPGTRSRHD